MSDRAPVRRLDWIGCLSVAALAVACSPTDSKKPEQERRPIDAYAVIQAAGASSISSDPPDRAQSCARQTMTFAVADTDEWMAFVDRIESQLPPDFQRRETEGGVTLFSRLLPGDAESIELIPAQEMHRAQIRYAICAS